MKIPNTETIIKVGKAGALTVAAVGVGISFSTMIKWPILNSQQVWLHIPCVEFTIVDVEDPKDKTKTVKQKVCSKQGPVSIYHLGSGPQDPQEGEAFMGLRK